jgi:hypothetical protein
MTRAAGIMFRNVIQRGNITHSFVERSNRMPGAVLGEFAPLGATGALLSAGIANEGRLVL